MLTDGEFDKDGAIESVGRNEIEGPGLIDGFIDGDIDGRLVKVGWALDKPDG